MIERERERKKERKKERTKERNREIMEERTAPATEEKNRANGDAECRRFARARAVVDFIYKSSSSPATANSASLKGN